MWQGRLQCRCLTSLERIEGVQGWKSTIDGEGRHRALVRSESVLASRADRVGKNENTVSSRQMKFEQVRRPAVAETGEGTLDTWGAGIWRLYVVYKRVRWDLSAAICRKHRPAIASVRGRDELH